MRIFVSAAEASSDHYAKNLIVQLKKQIGDDTSFSVFGIGGPELRSLDYFEEIVPAESLRVMGFIEVLKKYFSIRKIVLKVLSVIRDRKPDLILTFDYPEFHLQLLNKIKKDSSIFMGAYRACFIPPKVWVWRYGRVHKIRNLYDSVYVLFPFEKNIFQDAGIKTYFYGNPHVDQLVAKTDIDHSHLNPDQALHVAVLPGSRPAELQQHLPDMSEMIEKLSTKLSRPIHAHIAVPKVENKEAWLPYFKTSDQVSMTLYEGQSDLVLKKCPVGFIKSGTSVLESVVLGCYPIVFYQVGVTTNWIANNIVRYLGPASLPNILLGYKDRVSCFYKEFLGVNLDKNLIVDECVRVVRDMESSGPVYKQHLKNSVELRTLLIPFAGQAAQKWAESLLLDVRALRLSNAQQVKNAKPSLLVSLGSFVWSFINWCRRLILSGKKLSVKSVLVGNLQSGGAGKTPLIIALAKQAIIQGKTVAVLSRGYGRKSKEHLVSAPGELNLNLCSFGDELCEIRSSCPDVWIAVGKDRNKLDRMLSGKNIDLYLCDDGFQNLKFQTDVNVVCLTDQPRDVTVYRDFECVITRSDLIVRTKGRSSQIKTMLKFIPNAKVSVILGVANPDAVVRDWIGQGLEIIDQYCVRDHGDFNQPEVKKWIETQFASGVVVVCTSKDAPRLADAGFQVVVNEMALGKIIALEQELTKDSLHIVDRILEKALN